VSHGDYSREKLIGSLRVIPSLKHRQIESCTQRSRVLSSAAFGIWNKGCSGFGTRLLTIKSPKFDHGPPYRRGSLGVPTRPRYTKEKHSSAPATAPAAAVRLPSRHLATWACTYPAGGGLSILAGQPRFIASRIALWHCLWHSRHIDPQNTGCKWLIVHVGVAQQRFHKPPHCHTCSCGHVVAKMV